MITGKPASDYAIGELMAVTIARQMEIHDGDWAAIGAYSELPGAAMKLARLLYAPNMWWMSGGGGAINSTSKLVRSTSDFRVIRGAEYVMSMEDIVDIEMWRFSRGREKIVAVVGGIQIDKTGASNMVCVGDYADPTVRGVGTVGLCFGVSFSLLYFFTLHHNPRIFVDQVDFVSSPGHTAERRKYVPEGCEGPERVFSPLGVFDFESEARTMRVRSLHPGVSLAEVVEKTGFELVIPEDVPTTEPPSELELALLRNAIDPDGVLRELRITH
ncbi:MAG: CoA-transferase [Alphaproteobacteria bacterium]|nr:CoA-transferase [Alphaproteobacteria bacterium]